MTGPAQCDGCRARITFARITTTGRQMPLNHQPDPQGNVAVRTSGQSKIGRVVTKGAHLDADETLYMPHWATCPNRPKRDHDEPRAAAASPPQPATLFGDTP